MKLQSCLAQLPFRNLRVIAQLLDVRRGQNTPKAALVERLTTALLDTRVLERALEQLSADERAVLDALVAAGGQMPGRVFRERFGDIRPYRPWREDAPDRPWETPISPAEALWFRGLIYRFPRRPQTTYEVRVLIPDELLERLPPPQVAADVAADEAAVAADGAAMPVAVGDIATDVALFISLLHRADVAPLWERWLAPRYFRDLNRRLSVREDGAAARSELQTERVRFVHYVAEVAGLVGPSGRWLKPTPAAWAWLEAAPAARYRQLWSAWTGDADDGPALWQRYRLPGHEVEAVLEILGVVLERLAELEGGVWYGLDAFSEMLVEMAPLLSELPPLWRDDELRDVAGETVAALIEGPLAQWGVVGIGEPQGERAFTLSPLGEALLTGAREVPVPADAAFRIYDDLAVVVPGTRRLPELVQLEALADWQGWVGGARAYQVTRGSLSRALSRSMSLEEIVDVLARGHGEALAEEQVAVLETWAAEVRSVSLRRVTVLETREAERLQSLSARRGVRQYFRETLSPRAVAVDAERVENLLRALEREGVWPQVGLPLGEVEDSPLEEAGAAAYLWVAGQVYAQLGRWIGLPVRMPAAVLDDVAVQMGPEAGAVAESLVEETLERLAEAMDGWVRYPMRGAGLPPEETLPVLEAAIADEQTVWMTYWTAGRGERTVRRVDPYRIEWRGEVAYVVGYCHQRMDERVFRVDRIERLQVGRLEG